MPELRFTSESRFARIGDCWVSAVIWAGRRRYARCGFVDPRVRVRAGGFELARGAVTDARSAVPDRVTQW